MRLIDTTEAKVDAPQGLDHSLVSGIAWTAAMRWSAQVVSWIGTLYAARLLGPGDYGLVSMAMLAIGLARMVEDFGMDAILVQDRGIVGNDQARLAGLLLMLGAVLSALFMLLSYPVAKFFSEPKVQIIIVALSLVFMADALQVVPRAQLQRDLQFRRLGIASFVQVIATQLALVIAATMGLGHWSLVVNTLAGAAAVTLLLFYWSPFAVAWPRQLGTLLVPLNQGWRILASRAAWYAYSNSDQMVIGKVLGKDALGAYSFATTFSTLTQQEIGSVVGRVVPGIFSEVQKRPEALRRYFLLLTELVTVISFPIVIGLALLADLFVPLLLGPRWLAVIAPLQLLCIYSAFNSSQLLLSHVLMWTGQFRINMWCSILTGVTMPLVFLFAVDHGLVGIGWAWAMVYPIVNIPQFFYAFRTIGILVWDWVDALWPALAGCIMMMIAVLALRWAIPETSMRLGGRFAILVAAGAVSYLAMLWFGFRQRVLEFVNLARSLRLATQAVPSAAV